MGLTNATAASPLTDSMVWPEPESFKWPSSINSSWYNARTALFVHDVPTYLM